MSPHSPAPKLPRLLSALLALLFIALAPTLALAEEGPAQLGLRPVPTGEKGYFELTLAPGESHELTVELGNYGQEAAVARTYSANVYSLVNGGMGIGLADEPPSGTTDWLNYPPETFTLESRKAVLRTFTVTAPADALPGEYLTSIVIESAPDAIGGGGGTTVNQVLRQAIAVSITVPGPRHSGLAVGAADHRTLAGQSLVTVELRNSGNVRVRPAGVFILSDAAGAELGRYPLTLGTVYAGTTTQFEVPFAGALPQGQYRAQIELNDDEAGLAPVATTLSLSVLAPTPVPVPGAGAPDTPAPIEVPPSAGGAPTATPDAGALPELIWPVTLVVILLALLAPMLRRHR